MKTLFFCYNRIELESDSLKCSVFPSEGCNRREKGKESLESIIQEMSELSEDKMNIIYGQDAVTKEKVTDSSFEIDNSTNEKNKKYHIECQSTPDGSMLIRMFEYDSQIAMDDGEYKEDQEYP